MINLVIEWVVTTQIWLAALVSLVSIWYGMTTPTNLEETDELEG